MYLQIPIPGGETWVQFPIIAVIVLCFLIAFSGVFAFTRWAVNVYRAERDKDLAWREKQNEQREAAVAEQNRLWREAMAERDIRYEQFDQQREATVKDLSANVKDIAEVLRNHDAQAKQILVTVDKIDKQMTKPVPGRGKAPGG